MEEVNTKTENPEVPKRSIPQVPRIVIALVSLMVLMLVLVVVVSIMSDKKSTPTGTAVVTITNNGFIPATISVKKGTKITWTNTDTKLHQVASNPYPKDDGLKGLKSEILNNNQSYSFTATETGNFGYHDDRNPTVNGTIQVKK